MHQLFPKFVNTSVLQFAIGLLIALGACSTVTAQAGDSNSDYTADTYFKIDAGQRTGQLFVVLEFAEGWVGYSNTTPGALPTKIKVTAADTFEVVGGFTPLSDPHKKFDTVLGAEVHYHPTAVTWTAPIQLAGNTAAEGLEINVSLHGQVCKNDEAGGRCLLLREKLVAQYDGEIETPELAMTLESKRSHVVWSGNASPTNAKPGDTVSVQLTAKPIDGYKIYAFSAVAQDSIAQPTRIAMQRSNGWAVSVASPDREPKQKLILGEQQNYYGEAVTWTVDLTVPQDASPGNYSFQGLVGFQACTEDQCDRPAGGAFHFDVVVGQATEGESKIGFSSESSYGKATALANRKAQEAQLISK